MMMVMMIMMTRARVCVCCVYTTIRGAFFSKKCSVLKLPPTVRSHGSEYTLSAFTYDIRESECLHYKSALVFM